MWSQVETAAKFMLPQDKYILEIKNLLYAFKALFDLLSYETEQVM